ncbi:MAG: heparinase II/III family protein [Bacteroidales bacterium]|nr:heparinase II/III family protein [Bacteroidales bacterium]
MKRIVLSLALALLPLLAGAQTLQQALSGKDLSSLLVTGQKWVPYPAYSDRAGWDELLGEYKPQLIVAGEKYLHFDWLVIRATDYLEYNRSGNRYTQENRIRKNAEALSCLMVAELAEGKGRFLDDIMDGAFLFCEYTSWAVSHHLATFQKVRRPIPDYEDDILALYQGNFSQMLSWAWYFFHDEFDKEDVGIAARIRHEIDKRELTPFLERDDFDWMGFKPKIRPNNWNPWCNSNALVCFMLMENDPSRLKAAVEKSIRSLDRFLELLAADGGCDEGPVYWYASAGNLLCCLECLSLITGGQIDFASSPLIRNFGEYIVDANIEGSWQANFADSAPSDVVGSPTLFRYAGLTRSDKMGSFANHCYHTDGYDPVDANWTTFYRAMENLRACWTMQALPDKGYTPSDFVWYPVTELCFMRAGKGYLAVKGGHNHERHNHNDVGTCIYFYDGRPVLVDAGPATYNSKTFDKRYRYKMWQNSSDYHNLPNINGFAQGYGYEYKTTGTTADRKSKRFMTDIAKAYPDSAGIVSWKLDYRLLKDGSLSLTETFRLQKPAPVELHFLAPERPDISRQGKIGLNAGLTLHYDARALKASVEEIPVTGTGIGWESFGPSLYRLTLSSKSSSQKGTYSLKILR